MGNTFSCECCTGSREFICWLCELLEEDWFLLFVASGVALLMVLHLHVGVAMWYHCKLEGSTPTAAVGYGIRNGPHTWRSAVNNQSPINIDTDCVIECCFEIPLIWCGYDELPTGILLENNGHTLVLRATFQRERPCIDGADLFNSFSFQEISFRWSWYNDTGSEHTLDNEHFPLEMQCLHSNASDIENASSRGLLMVSYMFSLATDNPFLDVIIQYLVAIQNPGQSVEIPPFPLYYLMPAFYTQFYSYHGSMTEPPCHRGVEWFINPIPLAIGERQLHEIRKLRSPNGTRIRSNARPVQELGDRIVHWNLN